MPKREFVQLAHVLKPKHGIGGYYFSEKLDGHRCYWDGGISRGLLKEDVPWANTAKDNRYLDAQYSTGLWSRYGNVIHAPDWFLDDLPKCPLDGEMWGEGLTRQEISKIIKPIEPSEDWVLITYKCFDMPPYETMFAEGIIDNPNFKKVIQDWVIGWVADRIALLGSDFLDYNPPPSLRYESAYLMMDAVINGREGTKARPHKSAYAERHKQKELQYPQGLALKQIESWTGAIVSRGGEGGMVRDPNTTYVCSRSHKVLKIKPRDDMEGTVIGYITGRETDKGSKLLGKMGAMVLTLDDGKRLELSGFTDEERELIGDMPVQMCSPINATYWATENPETECPEWIEARLFPRGTRVSFKHRGFTDDGIPCEAAYWRKDEQI